MILWQTELIGELHVRECRSHLKLRFGRLDNASTKAWIVSRRLKLSLRIGHSNARTMPHTELWISSLPILQAIRYSNIIHSDYFRCLRVSLAHGAATQAIGMIASRERVCDRCLSGALSLNGKEPEQVVLNARRSRLYYKGRCLSRNRAGHP